MSWNLFELVLPLGKLGFTRSSPACARNPRSRCAHQFQRTICSLTALAAVLCMFLMPSAVRAQGGFDGPGTYEITNLKSGKVIDLDRNDKRTVIQFSSRGTDNQAWDIQSAGNGFYTLRNRMNGNALESMGTPNSTPVQATRFDGRSSQQWRFGVRGSSAVILSRSGKSLDVAGGTNSDGAAIQTYELHGDANQQFRFRRVDGDQISSIQNLSNSNTSTRIASPGSTLSAVGSGRTALQPGWNMFSAAQDVELGQQASREVTQQVLMLNDARVDNYLNALGRKLTANAPGFDFPYTFKAVNDRGINAFALPGGPIYINRGVIEAADNESQLAGVMAHEAAHVALRHGTNQASKASVAQMPLAILGGILGSDSTGATLAQLGAGFTVNSILLKYSRDAESQADLMATQMLFDAGYDPRGMSQFFQKLQGSNGIAFFNSHPNPDNRVGNVDEEIARLGTSSGNVTTNSNEFVQIKRYVQSLAAPTAGQRNALQQSSSGQPAASPADSSERFISFQNTMLTMNHPENWQVFGQGDAFTIVPRGGMVTDSNGNQAMAYGALVNVYEPNANRYGQQLQGPSTRQGTAVSAEAATNELIQELRQSNANLRVVRRHAQINFGNQTGLSTYLTNDSPVQVQGGNREVNWLVTVPQSDGLLFFVFTAPEREFQNYESTFQQMLYSVRLKQ
jgi:beta-barrel assembly-enhancing protease